MFLEMLSFFAKIYMYALYLQFVYICIIYSIYIYIVFSVYRFCKSFSIYCIPLQQSLRKLYCVRKPANLDVLHPHLCFTENF